jgi:serine/threonine protein kinase
MNISTMNAFWSKTPQTFRSPAFVSRSCSLLERMRNIWEIMIHISQGLKFLHDHGHAHRDLKPSNGMYIEFNHANPKSYTQKLKTHGSLRILELPLRQHLVKHKQQPSEGGRHVIEPRNSLDLIKEDTPIKSISGH